MSARGMPGKPTTRRYSAEEKEQAVRMVRALRAELGSSQGTVKRVAQQLGYGVESVRSWVKQAEIDSGQAVGTTTDEAARIKALEQENRDSPDSPPPSAAGAPASSLTTTEGCPTDAPRP